MKEKRFELNLSRNYVYLNIFKIEGMNRKEIFD